MELERIEDFSTKTHKFIALGKDEEFICFKCRIPVSEGFVCESDTRLVLCSKCQDEFDMTRCKHDKRGEHRHIKFERS